MAEGVELVCQVDEFVVVQTDCGVSHSGRVLQRVDFLAVNGSVAVISHGSSANKSTRYYIDEFHLLLKEEQTAAYSVEIWKRFRKWGGIPTGITQNVKVRPDRALCKAV